MFQNEAKDNSENLVISEEVIATIVSNAAKDIDGVAGMVTKNVEISNFLKTETASKEVKVEIADNIVTIDLFISIKKGFKVVPVAEAVQAAVKDTVQNMTGYAVSKVNVHVADVEFEKASGKKTNQDKKSD